MNIGLFESILYGLICGFAEFLPVSSQAHRNILNCLFGVDREEPLMILFLHIGALLALMVSSRTFSRGRFCNSITRPAEVRTLTTCGMV